MSTGLPTTTLSHLYNGDQDFASAQAAFRYAQAQFERHGTKDPKKKARLQALQTTTLEDLLDAVQQAQNHYTRSQSESTIRQKIEKFAEGVHHYSNIMDVMMQHHPEYVSLAWGAMKFLFLAIVEHKNTGLGITNGLLAIADGLSRAQITISLYPTTSIKKMFANLYTYIIRFLLRALDWYEEGSWKRILHSITKPLRYNDIINDINRSTLTIAAEASTNSQVEQRDIHHELIAARKSIEENQTSNSGEQAKVLAKLQEVYNIVVMTHEEQKEISRSVFRIESTQALHVISAQCSIDHRTDLQTSIKLRNQRRFTQKKTLCFWKNPNLHSWNQSCVSSILPVKVPCADRHIVQDFCTNIIEQLLSTRVVNLWVLMPRLGDPHPILATLKSLIYQAATFVNEDRVSRDKANAILKYLDQFNHARVEGNYLNVLAGLLRSFKVVYLIVQLEAVDPVYTEQFFSCLEKLIEILSGWGAETVIRILVLSWSPRSILNRVGQTRNLYLQRRGRSRRRGLQIPSWPLSM